jgi:hypothetical protein
LPAAAIQSIFKTFVTYRRSFWEILLHHRHCLDKVIKREIPSQLFARVIVLLATNNQTVFKTHTKGSEIVSG